MSIEYLINDDLLDINALFNQYRFTFAKIFVMKKWAPIAMIVMLLALAPFISEAQCSICTRSAQQLGEKPAKALNNGIVYLAAMPLAIFGFIAYKWWKINRD